MSAVATRFEPHSKPRTFAPGPLLLGLCLLLARYSLAFGWGHEGHAVVGLIAEHYMTGAALTRAGTFSAAAPLTALQVGPMTTGTIIRKPGRGITSTSHWRIPRSTWRGKCPNESAVCERSAQPVF